MITGSPLAARREGIAGGADRVLLPDLPALTLNDQLAATLIFEVAASGIDGIALGAVAGTCPRGSGVLHLPTIAIWRDEPAVSLAHNS